MPWYVWAVILYILIDRISGVFLIGKRIEVTEASVVLSMATGACIIWAVSH